jgi:hypothetical protein
MIGKSFSKILFHYRPELNPLSHDDLFENQTRCLEASSKRAGIDSVGDGEARMPDALGIHLPEVCSLFDSLFNKLGIKPSSTCVTG